MTPGQVALARAQGADRARTMGRDTGQAGGRPGQTGSAPEAPRADRQRAPRPILLTAVVAILAGAVLASLGWRLSGGGEFTVVTGSMCPDMCVGTLVLDRPLSGPAQPGMVVTFQPPGTSTVYTHRIVEVLGNGSFKTAGDALHKVDPWTVPPDRVMGRVVADLHGVGWLWLCAPQMTAALALYLIARRSLRDRVRPHADVLFVVVLFAVPILTMRPLLRESVIAIGRRGKEFVWHIANTGLLPAQVALGNGSALTHLASGQVTRVVTGASSPVWMTETVSFTPWQWAFAAAVIALPVVLLAVRVLRAQPAQSDGPAPTLVPTAVPGFPIRPHRPGGAPAQPLRWPGGAAATQARLAADLPGPDRSGGRPAPAGVDLPRSGQFVAAGPQGAALGAPGR